MYPSIWRSIFNSLGLHFYFTLRIKFNSTFLNPLHLDRRIWKRPKISKRNLLARLESGALTLCAAALLLLLEADAPPLFGRVVKLAAGDIVPTRKRLHTGERERT